MVNCESSTKSYAYFYEAKFFGQSSYHVDFPKLTSWRSSKISSVELFFPRSDVNYLEISIGLVFSRKSLLICFEILLWSPGSIRIFEY